MGHGDLRHHDYEEKQVLFCHDCYAYAVWLTGRDVTQQAHVEINKLECDERLEDR